MIWNERQRLQREKRLGPARGKSPPVVENQPSSVTEPKKVYECLALGALRFSCV
ncbi:MAG: hypothetical protein ACE3JN_02535 [Ectobacillus sp.]